MSKHVCIVQPVMKAYRAPFFEALYQRLSQSGVTLQVVYGTPWPEEALRGDHVDLPPPLGQRIASHMLFGRLFLLPVLKAWLKADLIIVEHANKHLLNYLLAILQTLGIKQVAYWGHGRDRQTSQASLGERFKRLSLHWAHWWFAYTAQSASYIEAQGFPPNRITVVENAIDTGAMREDMALIGEDELTRARQALALPEGAKIAAYCGSLYQNKRLDLLFGAADRVHRQDPMFHLLILGGGPMADAVSEFAASRPWVKAVGPKFGHEKYVLLKLASIWLNPGLVGLGILDAFCAGLPILTTDLPLHSPEIEYLRDGDNGLMVAPTVDDFAQAILRVMCDPALLSQLQHGADIAAKRYSIETMVENFATGVEQWLRLS